MEKVILKYALQNAIKYKGKANPKAIIGKILNENPSLKKNTKKVVDEINKIIKEVNSLSLKEQQEKLMELAPELLEKKPAVKKGLPELKNVKDKVILRFEPSPSGALHIGHTFILLLNSEYKNKYKGKLILRISDTDPGNIDPDSYNLIKEDAKWITKNNIDEVIKQSNRIEIYYDYAIRLMEMNKAYVCTCPQEEFKFLIDRKLPCECRNLTTNENLKKWKEMFFMDEGEAVLRLKTDLKHKNPAVRDWPCFRINHDEHPIKGNKYSVWPLMNFAVAIDDYESEITHVIRGKDHIVNTERQAYIFKYFKWKPPEYSHLGRINFSGIKMLDKLSASKARELITRRKFSGWDDIRLPFLGSYKRRGLQPEAFVRFIHETGPSKVDKNVDYDEFMKAIYSYNKKAIDKRSNRYFCIFNAKKIRIKDAPKLKSVIPLHPDVPSRGNRVIESFDEFYISDKLESNNIYRFMHLFNFKDKKFLSKDHDPSLNAKLIHWLPVSEDLVRIEVLMLDSKIKKGLAEPSIKKVKENQIVQFEREFFARLDKVYKDKLVFWYCHR